MSSVGGKIDWMTSGAVPAASCVGNVSATDWPLGPSILTSIPVSSSKGGDELVPLRLREVVGDVHEHPHLVAAARAAAAVVGATGREGEDGYEPERGGADRPPAPKPC